MRQLLAVILLTSFFRLFQLSVNPVGMYWDELDTGYQAYSLLQTGRDYFGNLFPAHLQSFADYRSGLYMYLTVPLVKLLGLTPVSVRLTAAAFSIVSVFLIYYLAKKHLGFGKFSWIPSLVIGLAPWMAIQGRIAAESALLIPLILLGLIYFFSKRYSLSALFFALTLWTYGTTKLFLPILLILLVVTNLRRLNFRQLLIPGLIFAVVAFLPVFETFSKPVGRRMTEVSVLTDPTIKTQVDFQRLQAALGWGAARKLGMQPGLPEKITINKLTAWGQIMLGNYVSALSPEFLFLSGDPNLRHHIPAPLTGQFYLVDLIAFVFGISFLLTARNFQHRNLLLLWLLLSPLPSIITRDGGNHAPRLIFEFIPVVLVISYGLKSLLSRRLLKFGYLAVLFCSLSFFYYYFFSTYKVISAPEFDTGFLPAVQTAVANSSKYDRVILDGANESLLMAYLFVARPNPAQFQKSFPLPSGKIIEGVEGYQFGNIVVLYPGIRNWSKITASGSNFVVVSTLSPGLENITSQDAVLGPDSTPLFVTLEARSSGPIGTPDREL